MWLIKRVYSFVSACVCVAVVGGLLWASGLCKLKEIDGKRTFYLYSASSQAVAVPTLKFEHLFSVKGESVRFSLNGADGQKIAEGILSNYGAELIQKETVDGVTSYYAYSPCFSNGIHLFSQKINLHVAVNDDECVVGNPIIFGGF